MPMASLTESILPSGRLAGKVALITGGASGVGRAICLRYAEEGANVVVADLREGSTADIEKDVTTVEQIRKMHPAREAIWVQCDVTQAATVDAAVKAAVDKFGRLDIMVNNAGISIEANYSRPIHEFTEDHLLDKTLNVNVKGVFFGIRAATAQMIKQIPLDGSGDRGWIINLGSIFSLVGCPQASCYVASKHAVLGLTRTAAIENAGHRIHVNAICPGFLETSLTENTRLERPESWQHAVNMHPWGGGGVGSPKDVCGVAVFLASEDARWMTGSAVTTDGGYTSL